MGKKFLFFIFLILIINLNGILAISFSPGDLIYKIDVGKEECKTINLNSESQTIAIFDKWAENIEQQRKPNLYTKTAEYHGLSLSYPKQISEGKEIRVCISGKYPGNYYGIIILQEEQIGNAIMQGGVWINVLITGNSINNEKKEQTQETTPGEAVQEKITENNSGITGAVIGALQRNIWVTATIFLLILIILYLLVLVHNKGKKTNGIMRF